MFRVVGFFVESFPLNISCLGGGSYATWYLLSMISKMMIMMIMELINISILRILCLGGGSYMLPGALHDQQDGDHDFVEDDHH